MDQLTVARPGWLDWRWALAVLDRDARVPGEMVSVAGLSASLTANGPARVTAEVNGDRLVIIPGAAAGPVRLRFHLGLDEQAVSAALERAALPALAGGSAAGWVRRPAAGSLWAYLLVYLSGEGADGPAVRRLFSELGPGTDGLAPEPGDLLGAGADALAGCGIAPHRAANLLGLARQFAARPQHYDEAALRELPARQAVLRLAELPHIGATRAAEIASGALGHDDVLPDLSRQHEQLARTLGLTWAQLRATADRAAPYRSVLGDTLRELLAE